MAPRGQPIGRGPAEPDRGGPPAHLAKTHEHYPKGFPKRKDDALLGHWKTPDGRTIVVEHHPHGYEIHFGPCYDFENCDACAPDRGPKNPHTNDGHHFRECPNHGVIMTVAGDKPLTVLEYLADAGSPYHADEFLRVQAEAAAAEAEERERDRKQTMRDELDQQMEYGPTVDDRLEALEAELRELREAMKRRH